MKRQYISIETVDNDIVYIFVDHIVSVYMTTRTHDDTVFEFGHILTSCGVVYTTKNDIGIIRKLLESTGWAVP